jgi:hypothetical protein
LYNLKSIRNFGMKFGGNIDWYLILIKYSLISYRLVYWIIKFYIVELKYRPFRILNLYSIYSKYETKRYNRLWCWRKRNCNWRTDLCTLPETWGRLSCLSFLSLQRNIYLQKYNFCTIPACYVVSTKFKKKSPGCFNQT